MCFCFPSSATVETVDGKRRVGELHSSTCSLLTFTPGGLVKKDTFLTFLHFDPSVMATYLAISCKNGKTLLISPEHLLFVSISGGSSTPVPAKEVEIGNSLTCFNENGHPLLTEVVEIREVEERGVFSPLSKSGTLLVDGFLVSCYAHVGSLTHEMAHASFAPLRFWFKSKHMYNKLMQTRKRANVQKVPRVGIHGYANGLINLRQVLPI